MWAWSDADDDDKAAAPVNENDIWLLLDLIDRVPDELWTEVYVIVQETGIKTIPMKRNAKRQNGCLRRPYK